MTGLDLSAVSHAVLLDSPSVPNNFLFRAPRHLVSPLVSVRICGEDVWKSGHRIVKLIQTAEAD